MLAEFFGHSAGVSHDVVDHHDAVPGLGLLRCSRPTSGLGTLEAGGAEVSVNAMNPKKSV